MERFLQEYRCRWDLERVEIRIDVATLGVAHLRFQADSNRVIDLF